MKPHKSKFSAAVAAFILAAFGFAATAFTSIAPQGLFEVTKHLEIFISVFEGVHTYYVDEPEPGSLMRVGIDAMLESLDPYTVYYPESRIEDLRFMNTGEYGGIGTMISQVDGKTTIMEVYEDYPAHKVGLRAGDVVVEVDGQGIANGLTNEEVSSFLKGQSGTTAQIVIERPGIDTPMQFAVERAQVRVKAVPFAGTLNDTTGYIFLSKFTRGSAQEVRDALVTLRDSSKIKQLVLDLRNNGGGLLRESISIVNLFVPKGEDVVYTRGKDPSKDKTYSCLNEPIAKDMPLIVLINENSASASEIVAGSLQDLDRAVVLGTESFGKGLVQQTKDMAFNTRLKVTISKYYTPSGRCIQRLDYGGKRDDTGHAVARADSLVSAFTTRSGRPVTDGRGILPDSPTELPYMSSFVEHLYADEHIFKYAVSWGVHHDSIADPLEFALSQEDLQGFLAHLEAENFTYDSEMNEIVDVLSDIAEYEGVGTVVSEELQALRSALALDHAAQLELHGEEIRSALEEEIVLHYHFADGMLAYSLKHDPLVDRALEVFGAEADALLAAP
ncbi:MAG: S41 family peptidase [Flavobacteriales bacterium]|nr:S41 family peptidase [Flavobacteriales bacterium]